MAKPASRARSYWKPYYSLTIPPESMPEWIKLGAWECGVGAVVCTALVFGTRLIRNAPHNLVTVFDFTNCYAAPPIVQPCERVAYRAGMLNVVLNAWFGWLFVALAALLLWQLWTDVAPIPITDEFLKLLDHSFGRDWRRPRTWPWGRIGWAYGFTFVGALLTFGLGTLVATTLSSSSSARMPAVHVETSERFRPTDGPPR